MPLQGPSLTAPPGPPCHITSTFIRDVFTVGQIIHRRRRRVSLPRQPSRLANQRNLQASTAIIKLRMVRLAATPALNSLYCSAVENGTLAVRMTKTSEDRAAAAAAAANHLPRPAVGTVPQFH